MSSKHSKKPQHTLYTKSNQTILEINIYLSKEDFEDIDFKNNFNKDYILKNYQDFINWEGLINNSTEPLNTISDNRWEMTITNEDWYYNLT